MLTVKAKDQFRISSPNQYHPRTWKLILVRSGVYCIANLDWKARLRDTDSIDKTREVMERWIDRF